MLPCLVVSFFWRSKLQTRTFRWRSTRNLEATLCSWRTRDLFATCPFLSAFMKLRQSSRPRSKQAVLQGQSEVIAYLDDILVTCPDFQEQFFLSKCSLHRSLYCWNTFKKRKMCLVPFKYYLPWTWNRCFLHSPWSAQSTGNPGVSYLYWRSTV